MLSKAQGKMKVGALPTPNPTHRTPLHWNPNAKPGVIQRILDSNSDVVLLLAPSMMIMGGVGHGGRCVAAAKTFWAVCRDFRRAITPLLEAWGERCNSELINYQCALKVLLRGPPQPPDDDSDEAEEPPEHAARQVAWTEAQQTRDQTRAWLLETLDEDTTQCILKGIEYAGQNDIRGYDVPTGAYTVGRSVHLFLSVSSGGCEMCFDSKCDARETFTFTPLPFPHNCRRVMWCQPCCLHKNCVVMNPLSAVVIPLKATLTAVEVRAHMQKRNAKICHSMLRQTGVGAPFYIGDVKRLVGTGRFDNFFGPSPASYYQSMSVHLSARRRPRPEQSEQLVLLYDHPAIPLWHPTCQNMFNLDTNSMRRAMQSIDDEMKCEKEMRAFSLQLHHNKAVRDFERLLNDHVVSAHTTIADVDAFIPGFGQAFKIVQQHGAKGAENGVESGSGLDASYNILDAGHVVRRLAVVAGIMDKLPRHDMQLSGARASPQAYSFVTGVAIAQFPSTTYTNLCDSLHLAIPHHTGDDDEMIIEMEEWREMVRSMHVFDALHPSNCTIRARNSDGGKTGEFEWVVKFEDVTLSGTFEPLETLVAYQQLRNECIALMDSLGWSAEWPPVPPLDEIRKLYTLRKDVAKVLNFFTVIAQQLLWFRGSRAMGVSVLTGNRVKSFFDAVRTSSLDVEVLVQLAALDGAGTEPFAQP